MRVTLTCHDIASIQFHDTPESVYARLVARFPHCMDAGGHPHAAAYTVAIHFAHTVTLPNGARHVGLNAAYADSMYYVSDRNGRLIGIDVSDSESRFHCRVSNDIDYTLLEGVVEILLHTLAVRQGKAFFHSGGIGVNGHAVLFCGWANIGKTNVIVELLKRGHPYLGDDWTIVSEDGLVYSYDKAITMYAYDIVAAPEIAEMCHGKTMGRLIASYCRLCRPSKVDASLGLRARITQRAFRQLARLVHFPMCIYPSADQITSAGTLQAAPLRAVYFMMRAEVPEIQVAPLDTEELIGRMLACYRYDTRLFFDPTKLQFAFPFEDADLGLGIRVSDVKAVWSKAFSHANVQRFTVLVPATFGPQQLVTGLRDHMAQWCV